MVAYRRSLAQPARAARSCCVRAPGCCHNARVAILGVVFPEHLSVNVVISKAEKNLAALSVAVL